MEDLIKEELSFFENFFTRMGLKRIDGSVYGLLTLSENPLRSEEIEKTLGLSQSAVSMALKNLQNIGAIDTTFDQNEKRVKLHSAKDEALTVVASVFRKREQEAVNEFKEMAKRVQNHSNVSKESKRHHRLQSIIETCETAEAVMDFVINITKNKTHNESRYLAKQLPMALKLIERGVVPAKKVTETMKNSLKDKLMIGLEKIEKNLENHKYEREQK